MVDYAERYQEIVDGLIEESFLELKGEKVRVSEMGEFRRKVESSNFYFFIKEIEEHVKGVGKW